MSVNVTFNGLASILIVQGRLTAEISYLFDCKSDAINKLTKSVRVFQSVKCKIIIVVNYIRNRPSLLEC